VHNPCGFSPRNLQHEFSAHASHFGVTGPWNKDNAELFQQAVQDHIEIASQQIMGTYRGTMPVTHYYEPATRLWAAVDASNTFTAGWKLSLVQEAYLLSTGNVQ